MEMSSSSSPDPVINNGQPSLDCGLFDFQGNSGLSSSTEQIMELINQIKNSNNNTLGLSNSMDMPSPLSGKVSPDLSSPPPSNDCSLDNNSGGSPACVARLASPSFMQQQIQQFQLDMAVAAFRQNGSSQESMKRKYTTTKTADSNNVVGSDSDECDAAKHIPQYPSSMESPFAQFFPTNPCSDLLMAAAAASSVSMNAPSSSSFSLMDWNLKQMPALKSNSSSQNYGSTSVPTKKLRGIVTRADFMEKIEKAENLDDCKKIFLSILDVILPGKASQNVAVNIPMQNNFDITRISPKFVKVSQDREEIDLHKLFASFWVSKSHLSVKNIPSAFTRFVLSKVLGDEISKFTYCKLNNGKRGYKQLSNEFVKAITEFVAEGFGIPESDTNSRIALRNAVENVIINTCGNARKRVTGPC
uniref:BEN domain-containing protein n=1 Tax=Ditylenchus dipsaci TaxID=166011 RepID=A0A915CQ89_9BILA